MLGSDSANLFMVSSSLVAGAPSMYCVRWSNEAATVHADITADHRDVPASIFMSIFPKLDAARLTQEPPCRFVFQTVSNSNQTFRFPFHVIPVPVRFSQSVHREHVAISRVVSLTPSCQA